MGQLRLLGKTVDDRLEKDSSIWKKSVAGKKKKVDREKGLLVKSSREWRYLMFSNAKFSSSGKSLAPRSKILPPAGSL